MENNGSIKFFLLSAIVIFKFLQAGTVLKLPAGGAKFLFHLLEF